MKKSNAKFESLNSKLFKSLEKSDLKKVKGGVPPIWTMAEVTILPKGSDIGAPAGWDCYCQ